MSWEYCDVKTLIRMYKEAPELWDPEHSEYHNPLIVEKIHRTMASKFNKDIYEIKAKLKSLRCMYLRQYKKVQQNEAKQGYGSNILWFGYKPMSFLEKVYNKNGSFKEDDTEDQGDTMDSYEEGNLDEDVGEQSDDNNITSSDIIWTRDDVIKLIEMYKDYPILWDVDHPNYHHKQMRSKVMKLIAENFNTVIPEIKSKIKNMRTMFLNMHKKVKSTIEQEGKWSGKVWYGYKRMEFLLKEGIPDISEEASPTDPSWRKEFDNGESMDGQETSSKTHWDQREFLKLIKLYENQRSLWDTEDDDYNNRFRRTQCMKNIAEKLDKPRSEVESKIRNLRTQFFKNHKRVQEMVRTEGKVTGKLWFGYKPMLFLANLSDKKNEGRDRDKVVVKKEHFPFDDDDDSYVSTNSNEMLEIELPVKRERKKRKISESSSDDYEDPLEFTSSTPISNNKKKPSDPVLIETKTKTEDEFVVFGQFITQELKKIKDEYALMIAKKQISEIVFQAQVNQASVSSGNKNNLQ